MVGKTKHPLYKTWTIMKWRCRPGIRDSKYYYDKGITVCDRWANSFESFLEDMGEKPSPLYTLDRIDNNKGYFPENCRWATKEQQMQNRGPYKNTQIYNGVKWSNLLKRWVVTISIEGRTRSMGMYRELDEALSVRLSAEAEYWL